jgi:hypothetical protein
MSKVFQFDLGDVIVTWGSFMIEGAGDGNFVAIKYDNPLVTEHEGGLRATSRSCSTRARRARPIVLGQATSNNAFGAACVAQRNGAAASSSCRSRSRTRRAGRRRSRAPRTCAKALSSRSACAQQPRVGPRPGRPRARSSAGTCADDGDRSRPRRSTACRWRSLSLEPADAYDLMPELAPVSAIGACCEVGTAERAATSAPDGARQVARWR